MLLSSRRPLFHQACGDPLSRIPSFWTLSDSVAETRWLIITPPCRMRTHRGLGLRNPPEGILPFYLTTYPHNAHPSTPNPHLHSPDPLLRSANCIVGGSLQLPPPICLAQTDGGLAERNPFFDSICGSSLFSLPCLSLNAIAALAARARREQEILGILSLTQQRHFKRLLCAA